MILDIGLLFWATLYVKLLLFQNFPFFWFSITIFTVSNRASDEVTNYVTHRIFNKKIITLLYSYYTQNRPTV